MYVCSLLKYQSIYLFITYKYNVNLKKKCYRYTIIDQQQNRFRHNRFHKYQLIFSFVKRQIMLGPKDHSNNQFTLNFLLYKRPKQITLK